MALVLTQEGAVRLWQWWLRLAAPVFPTVHLLQDNVAPLHTWKQIDFHLHELVADGYAGFELFNPGTNWALTQIPQGAQAANSNPNWVLTGAATIWGYWLSDDDAGISLWGGLFPFSFVFNPLGGSFTVDLLPTLISQP